jgi:hypothetical protein
VQPIFVVYGMQIVILLSDDPRLAAKEGPEDIEGGR